MTLYWLHLTTLSDTAFGRGSGVPGLIDQDVAIDKDGCPYLHGRTLKGLLNEACAEILYALDPGNSMPPGWIDAADGLFGRPGSRRRAQGKLRVGHAQLPEDLRRAIHHSSWDADAVTDSLTTVRQQTSLKADGAPEPHTLRSVRLILRNTPFVSELNLSDELTDDEKGLLAASVLGLRRAGTARNRGRGLLHVRIFADEVSSPDAASGQASEDIDNSTDLTCDWYATFFQKKVCLS
ncbi:MAG: hypothetical protein KDD92_04445 [Caldilineaceae bacterium]|nr:hypothetical protein [Caldilineaceae bacterium]